MKRLALAVALCALVGPSALAPSAASAVTTTPITAVMTFGEIVDYGEWRTVGGVALIFGLVWDGEITGDLNGTFRLTSYNEVVKLEPLRWIKEYGTISMVTGDITWTGTFSISYSPAGDNDVLRARGSDGSILRANLGLTPTGADLWGVVITPE